MVESLRRSSLEGVADFKTRKVAVSALPPLQRYSLRCGEAAWLEAGAAFGVPLPLDACRVNVEGDRSALWLGPDEWLLLGPVGTAVTIHAPHSLVDISHRQMALEVSGSRAEDLLNAGVMLDLRLTAFPVNTCARTLLGKADVVVWRTDTNRFHLEVWRSFAPYVRAYLEQASAGL